MRNRGSSLILQWASLVFILLAVVLTVVQLIQYSLLRADYPPDMTIAGVPVGNTDAQVAAQRIRQVYSIPVEIHYGDAIIDLNPSLIGFQLDIESMLAAADLQRTGASFWGGFWDFLWNRRSPAREIPLVSSYSEERLRAYLRDEITSRYDQPATPAQPIPGKPEFSAGTPGRTLDVDRAVVLIESALKSPNQRVVQLSSQRAAPGRPSLQSLQILMQQIIDQNGFDGITDIYFLDLQSAEKLHFAYQAGGNLPVNPDISFGASSTIKIPILVTVYLHYNSNLDDQTRNLLDEMIAKSDNTASDILMMNIDETRGPLIVSETMQKLGLKNTFLAGYFHPKAPLLQIFNTPANSRTDVNTDPDIYNQTTPSDIGMLLEDIYQCSQTGGGAIVAAFPGQINQGACKQIIEYLTHDKVGALIQVGVPEGTVVAHKHGWVTDINGIMHTASDAAIVYTPAGNYILTIYTYHPIQIIWEDPVTHLGISRMFTDLSRAVYNYMNLSLQ